MKSKTYEERLGLKLLKLTTLERRRQRGDLIEVYKIVTGKEDIDSSCLFQLASQDLNFRGHHLKLYKKPCHLNVRKYYFSQRIVNSWNSLPKSVVEAPSVNSFKNRLDKYFTDMDSQ